MGFTKVMCSRLHRLNHEIVPIQWSGAIKSFINSGSIGSIFLVALLHAYPHIHSHCIKICRDDIAYHYRKANMASGPVCNTY